MAIDFPLSPAADELYTNGERTWRWNGVAWQLESTGVAGEPGPIGPDGPSAYEVAVANGFVGTEEEWLATLVGPQGIQGASGPPGIDGASAYQVAVEGGFVGTEEEWLASLVGPEGPEGIEGPMGTQGIGIRYITTVATEAELPATATQGDLYVVSTPEPAHGFVFEEATSSWRDSGPVQGPQGIQGIQGGVGPAGPTGADGLDGASAYDVAVENGYTGTEAEWLLSLVGATGADGAQGIQGEPGIQGGAGVQGEVGPAGPDGPSAYEVAVNNGFVGTEADWLLTLVGPVGPKGPIGPQGVKGDQGTDGPQGEQGIQGIQGIPGLGITFKGQVPTEADLPAGAAHGDAYIVQADDSFWVYDGTASAWVNGGSIQGPQGIQGEQGIQGIQGKTGVDGIQGIQGETGASGADGPSAYEVAVAGGFVGTEAEWLLSLVGEQGIQGEVGPAGPTAVSADAGNTTVLGTDGLIYTPAGNVYTFAPTPPATANNGDWWTDSNSGRTYVYCNDGNSAQWVEY